MRGAPNTSANLSCLGLKWHANFWEPRSGQLPVGRRFAQNLLWLPTAAFPANFLFDDHPLGTILAHQKPVSELVAASGDNMANIWGAESGNWREAVRINWPSLPGPARHTHPVSVCVLAHKLWKSLLRRAPCAKKRGKRRGSGVRRVLYCS